MGEIIQFPVSDCPFCNGAKSVRSPRGVVHRCEACHGTGRIVLSLAPKEKRK